MGGKVRPQATEVARMETGVFGLVVSIVAYLGYLVYKDLQKPWSINRDDESGEIRPQAEELPVSTPPSMLEKQNVMFSDTHPGFMQEVPGDIDHIRDAALTSDATLDEFFSRPLRIQSFDWAVGGLLFQRFNPWRDYFENVRVINRVSNYKLMRAKLHIKITLNGNAFHYGRAIAAYNPLPDDDTMTIDRAFLDADLVAASQRPHIYLDPTNSQGGEMMLPFFTYHNVWDVTAMDWRKMGELVIHSMQRLKHANGATDTVTVNVFAWAEDVKFAIPTQFEPGSIAPQADEYGKKPVSRIAGAVANAASYLTQVPMIGPFARATQIGADAIGAMATLFGYSSPVHLDSSLYRPVSVFNIAATNVPNESHKLTVDCKQELTLDPRTVGLDGKDELALKNITQRESWMASYSWNLGTVQETLLWNHVVDPCVHYVFGQELHMPAVCFASVPFKFWRGTLKYRFQFVCSKYHKGRVKIVYDPTGTPPGGAAEYNTAYTTIVDISDTTDFEIAVGWGQRDPYREHFSVGTTTQAQMWNTTPLTTTTPASPVGNGTLSVYVVNELTVPNSVVNNDIECNVFITAGDDFELAVPDATVLEKLRFRTAGATIAPQACEIYPQAGESEEINEDSKPSNVTTLNTNANSVSITDETNMIYFGESIHSFRQMLKRYSRHSYIPGPFLPVGNLGRLAATRHAFPYQVGYTDVSVPANSLVTIVDGGVARYVYGYTTLLNYVTSAYGGWRGSIRWMTDVTRFNHLTESQSTVVVTRSNIGLPANNDWLSVTSPTFTPLGQADLVNNRALTSRTFDGQLYQSSAVNPVAMFEVPYYQNVRFTPAKRLDFQSLADIAQNGWTLEVTTPVTSDSGQSFAPVYCSAGEDFNCFFFLGAPIMYYEAAAPES